MQANWLLDDLVFEFDSSPKSDCSLDWPEVLGVSRKADVHEIKAAFRNAIRAYHPDLLVRSGPKLRALAEEETRRITAAYEAAKSERRF